MSTSYCFSKRLSAGELFDGRLEKFGVREHVEPDQTTGTRRYLTDGHNYMSLYVNDDGSIDRIVRYGFNAPGKILNVIAKVFDADIFSEQEAILGL
jgi:hypothetical protein